MLIRLDPKKVKLGMFLHSFEGSFADRPFWQSHFVLTDPNDLERLHRSSIEAVIVDTGKSVSVSPRDLERPRPPRAKEPPAARPLDDDEKRALATVNRSKQAVIRLMTDVRLGRPISMARLMPVVAELSAEIERTASSIISLLRMRSRDEYTYVHSVAVSALMMNLARTLKLDPALLDGIGMAGLLHDVGKIAMPEAILNKPGQLTSEEFAVMKRHPGAGGRILQGEKSIPEVALDVCLNHHERMDGSGYPLGRTGENLSLPARMGAICDVYDALTSDRAYKDAWPPQQALAEMQRWKGHFDPELLTAFVRSLGIYPIGTLVSVRGNALAIVIADNAIEPTCPTIRAFYSIPGRCRVPCEDVTIGNPGILALETPADWGFDDWTSLSRELLGAEGDAKAETDRMPTLP